MKSLVIFIAAFLSIMIIGCSKVDDDDILMYGYYLESQGLDTLSDAKVREFGDEFIYVTENRPELKTNRYYHPTYTNLEKAHYFVTATFTSEGWNDPVNITFDF